MKCAVGVGWGEGGVRREGRGGEGGWGEGGWGEEGRWEGGGGQAWKSQPKKQSHQKGKQMSCLEKSLSETGQDVK